MVMVCPYRKRIVSEIPKFEKEIKGTTQSEEMFAECQGEICPLYNPTMVIPCVRATKERNEAYIKIRENEGGVWGN